MASDTGIRYAAADTEKGLGFPAAVCVLGKCYSTLFFRHTWTRVVICVNMYIMFLCHTCTSVIYV